jgi:hypothetical protein
LSKPAWSSPFFAGVRCCSWWGAMCGVGLMSAAGHRRAAVRRGSRRSDTAFYGRALLAKDVSVGGTRGFRKVLSISA